ncbi:hypothetical protein [Nakamurella endophytica]|nr:hypothetical protein [Nakamurella endophytica]
MLLDCGLRVFGLCGLRVADVNPANQMALVNGKGNKVRAVYFGHRTAAAGDLLPATPRCTSLVVV